MLKLIIEDDEGRKTVVPFVRDEITIGRQEGNTIRLTERNVSRRHARLVRQNGHVLVEDLGSYNGVRINGERIQGQAQIADGDLIQIGDYDLAVQREAAAQPPPQPPPQPQPQVGAPTIRLPAAALQAALDELQAKPSPTETDLPAQHEEEDEDEDEAPTPTPADLRRNSTAVIRMDQVEMNRPRKVSPVDASEAPHLLVVSAELKGQEFACLRTEVRIGRTDDNDITIDHRSLSRTHAKIVREESGEWRIIDMQSANGMAVNGESYAQAPLSHGDLIELGHVKLRFIGPGQSAEGLTHEGTAKGSKKGLMLTLVACVLLGVGGGAAWFLFGQTPADPVPPQPVAVNKPSNPAQAQTPGTEKQPSQPTLSLEEKLQSARAAIDARDFDTAVDTLESIQDAKGQRPTEAEELLKQAQAEQESKHNLDLAQKEFDANRLQEAQKYLEAAEGTLAFADEHTALKEKVEAALDSSEKPGTSKPPASGTGTTGTATARRPSTEQQAKQLYDDGVTLVRKQQLPEAESVLKKCITIEPTYAPCYLALGATVARRKRPDEGAQYYREFLRLAPDHEMAPGVKKLVADYEKSQKQPGGGK
ncbi:FHA domain-containing protein [Archangium violaceum]|uniref:FHA domain-containing protein n=1 Tax=Archangium violaceum TaxID=83451 RepID=UPI002B2B2156|nr:FHA domain-containing protein [Archangium violaceum]